MRRRKLHIILPFLLLALVCTDVNGQLSSDLKKLSDASNEAVRHQPNPELLSYEQAVQKWKTVSDVATWIKENFQYDMGRAKSLAENSSARDKTLIYTPGELYQFKKGVCIDLSRFAVETINLLDTSKHVQYLMIDFEPIVIDSSILKKHWIATYQDPSGYYFLADSKRPGNTAGPYKRVEDFISEYQSFRERKILSWKILPSYEKKKKKKTIQNKID